MTTATLSLSQQIEEIQSEAIAGLRETIITAATDETRLDPQEVLEALNRAGKDPSWFDAEVTRCRNRITASETLEEIARSAKELEKLAQAHHTAAAELQALKERHKAELKAAQLELQRHSSKATGAASRSQRRRAEAEQLLRSTISPEHRNRITAAADHLAALRDRLTATEAIPSPEIQWLRNALQRLLVAEIPPERIEQHQIEIRDLERRIEAGEAEERRHIERIEDLRVEIDIAEEALQLLEQASFDPLETF